MKERGIRIASPAFASESGLTPTPSQFVFVTRPGERRIVVTLGALEPR